jgi:hypothetical protein
VVERDKLETIFLVNETPERAREIATYKTNCATFMRVVYAMAGCRHPLITCPYTMGQAVTWILEVATKRRALHYMQTLKMWWSQIEEGWGLYYEEAKTNNNHLEFALGSPGEDAQCEHGGGGRSFNAITVDRGDIRWSTGKPLVAIIDPVLMCDEPRYQLVEAP